MTTLISWIFSILFGKGILALYCVVITILSSYKLYKKLSVRRHVSTSVWIFTTSITLVVVLVIYITTVNIVVNTIGRPSNVDVSALATLNEEHVLLVEDTILHLESKGILQIREVREFYETDYLKRSYDIRWYNAPIYPNDFSLRAVRLFRYDEDAALSVQPRQNPPIRRHTHSCYIQNGNNTSALLVYPEMPVSASGLYFPSNMRWIVSEVQIGKLVFTMVEVRQWYNLHTNYSTRFIEMLVEASLNLYIN